jgi:hypothetical protein
MKIKIPYAPCGLMEFYDRVATEMGHGDLSEFKYNVSKINIAENIQDGFYEFYDKVVSEKDPTLSKNDIRVGITMLLVNSGPKVDKTLKANEVEIFDGFIC